jgi:hypothetical protein
MRTLTLILLLLPLATTLASPFAHPLPISQIFSQIKGLTARINYGKPKHGLCTLTGLLTEHLPRTNPFTVDFEVLSFFNGWKGAERIDFSKGPQWTNGQNLYTPQRMQNELIALNDAIEPDSELRNESRDFASMYPFLTLCLRFLSTCYHR